MKVQLYSCAKIVVQCSGIIRQIDVLTQDIPWHVSDLKIWEFVVDGSSINMLMQKGADAYRGVDADQQGQRRGQQSGLRLNRC
jgi:hypothetical protein